MANGTSSARYTDLYSYARTALQIDQDLIQQADRLISRLSYFEATCEEPGFRVSSDGLGSALRSYGTRCEPVDRHVQTVGEAFQRADSSLWRYIISPPGKLSIIGIPGWRWPWPDLHIPWIQHPRWINPPIFEIPWRIPRWRRELPPIIIRPPWRWWPIVIRPPRVIFPIFLTPISIMPILTGIPDWIRGPVVTLPERGGFGDLIDEAPSEASPTKSAPEIPIEKTPPKGYRPGEIPHLRQDEPEDDDKEFLEEYWRYDAWKPGNRTVREDIKAYGCLMTCYTMLIRGQGHDTKVTDLYRYRVKEVGSINAEEKKIISKDMNTNISTVNDYLKNEGVNGRLKQGTLPDLTKDEKTEQLKNQVNTSGPVVLHVNGATSDGHWVVVAGVNPDGSLIVLDPDKKDPAKLSDYMINKSGKIRFMTEGQKI